MSTVSLTKPSASAAGPSGYVGPSSTVAISAAGAEAFKEVFGAIQGMGPASDKESFSPFNGLYIGPYGRGPAGVKAALAPTRFGDVLTTPVVAATLIDFRSKNEIQLKPSRPSTLHTYDDALVAIRTHGYPKRDGVTMSYRI